jgi:hypothetical protein
METKEETYTLTAVAKPAKGVALIVAPDSATYALNQSVNVSFQLNSTCQTFSHWEGDCTNGLDQANCQLTMNKNQQVTAHFTSQPIKINLGRLVGGRVEVSPNKASYDCGDEVVFTALPDIYSVFLGWTGEVEYDHPVLSLPPLVQDVNLAPVFSHPSSIQIEPKWVHPRPNQKVTFTASQGQGNFFWAATAAGLETKGNIATFTVPEEGVFYVWVSDGHGFAYGLVDTHRADDAPIILHMSPSERVMNVSDEPYALQVQAYGLNGEAMDVTQQAVLHNADKKVASVKEGLLTAHKVGETVITANYQSLKAQLLVTVKDGVQFLKIQPDILELLEGGARQAVKVYGVTQSGKETLLPNPTLEIVDKERADLFSGEIKGVKLGTTQLKITAAGLTQSIPIVVRPVLPLRATPSNIRAQAGETIEVTVTGGEMPYQTKTNLGEITQINPAVFHYRYGGVSMDELKITDKQGKQVVIPIQTFKALSITPEQETTTAGGRVALQVTGGDRQYQWHVTHGNITDTTGNNTTYIAPKTDGLYSVLVSDGLQNRAESIIVVGKGLYLTPQALYLKPREKAKVSILGGNPSYQVKASGGQAYIEDKTVFYTAPKASGDHHFEVTDSNGNQVKVSIKVGLDLMISPQVAHTHPKQTLTLHVAGGFGNIHWIASKGVLNTNKGDKVIWTAPKVHGSVKIHATDDAGAIASANVEVNSEDMLVTPSSPHVFKGEKADLAVLGGVAPYTWVVDAGDYQADKQGGVITYTAPDVKGSYTIEVTDNAGKKARAQVNVYSDKLLASPKKVHLKQGESIKIKVSGGTQAYTLFANSGQIEPQTIQLTLEQTAQTATYTASSAFAENDQITVMDSSSNLLLVNVEIESNEKINRVKKVLDAYTGSDGQLNHSEVEKGLKDFFTGQGWMEKEVLYWMTEQFLQQQ